MRSIADRSLENDEFADDRLLTIVRDLFEATRALDDETAEADPDGQLRLFKPRWQAPAV